MFMLCDSVGYFTSQPNVEIPQLTGPQVALRPMFIPGNFSFGISAGISGVDLQKTNTFRFTIKSPEGVILQESGESIIPLIPGQDIMPTEYQGFVLTLDIRNLVIEKSGIYTFDVFVNGEQVGSRPIPIFKANRK